MSRNAIRLCLSIPFMLSGCVESNSTLSTAPVVSAASRVQVIAHRGASRDAPENTIPAFRLALKAGVDFVELDYRHSADGVPIVIHDETLDRTTNAATVFGRSETTVASVPFADLQKLDAGSWFDSRFAGTPLPTLDEALDAIQQNATTLIEHKDGDAKTCVELLRRKGMVRDVIVQSFDWNFVSKCHELEPELRLAALCKSRFSESKLDEIKQTGAGIAVWKERHLGTQEIASIHRQGLKAWAYTVNDSRRCAELINSGIDGIITDTPGEIPGQLSRDED